MSVNVGYATLSVIPSAVNFQSALQRQVAPQMARAGTTSGRTFSRSFSTAASSGLRSFTTTAGAQIRRGTDAIGNAFGSIATTARRSLAVASTAAAAAAGGFATLGLSTAAGLQTARIGFETLLDSGKRAVAFLGRLRGFAVRTPFEVEGLIGNARALLGVGTAARDVIPTLTALGDTTAALGLNQDQFNGILRAYTQIASKGKVQAEELLQISENGIPAVQLLAKALGLTVPQLQAMTAAGELTANVALPALLKQLNKDYGGSMNRQFGTLTGVFNNFKESAKLALSDGVQPLLPILQNAFPRATEALGHGIKAVSGALAGFIRGVQGVGAKDGKVSFFEQLGSGAQRAITVIRGAVGAILPTLRSLGNFVVDKVVPALQSAFSGVLPALRRSFGDVSTTISSNQGTFRALGKILTDIVIPAVGKLAKFLAEHAGPAFRTVVGVMENFVIPVFVTLFDTIGGVIDLIVSGLANAFGWLPGLGGKLKAANRAWDEFYGNVNAIIRDIEATNLSVTVHFRTVADDISGGFDGETLTPQQAAAKNRQRVIAESTKATKAAQDAIAAKAGAINTTFGGIGTGAIDALADGLSDKKSKAAQAAEDAAQKVIDKAKDALRNARQELRDFAASIRDSIRSFGDLTGITSATGAAATPASLQRFLDKQLASITAFRKNLQALARRGISDSLLTKIANAGVETGGPVAAALVRARGAVFDSILATDKKIDRNARLTGGFVAERTLGDEVKQARIGVVNVTVNNPRPERASESTPKAVRRSLVRAIG